MFSPDDFIQHSNPAVSRLLSDWLNTDERLTHLCSRSGVTLQKACKLIKSRAAKEEIDSYRQAKKLRCRGKTLAKASAEGRAIHTNPKIRELPEVLKFRELDIFIENPTGTFREGFDPDGERWQTFMEFPYGYIVGIPGNDGDDLDVFLGPNQNSELVVVIQIKDPVSGEYDEDKVFLGFDSIEDAVIVFAGHYGDPEDFLEDILVMSYDDFLDLYLLPELIKAQRAEVGEVREWNGQKMKKTGEGKWEPVTDREDGQQSGSDLKRKALEEKQQLTRKERIRQMKEGIKTALKGMLDSLSLAFQGKAVDEPAAQTVQETGQAGYQGKSKGDIQKEAERTALQKEALKKKQGDVGATGK